MKKLGTCRRRSVRGGLAERLDAHQGCANGLYCAVLRGVAQGAEIRIAQATSRIGATRCIVLDAFRLMSVILAVYLAFLFVAGDFCVIRLLPEGPAFDPKAVKTAVHVLFLIIPPREVLETVQQIFMAALKGRGATMPLLRTQFTVTCLTWLPLLVVVRACHPTLAAYWLSTLFYMLHKFFEKPIILSFGCTAAKISIANLPGAAKAPHKCRIRVTHRCLGLGIMRPLWGIFETQEGDF